MGKLKSSFPAGNELVPSMTKNTAWVVVVNRKYQDRKNGEPSLMDLSQICGIKNSRSLSHIDFLIMNLWKKGCLITSDKFRNKFVQVRNLTKYVKFERRIRLKLVDFGQIWRISSSKIVKWHVSSRKQHFYLE
jgi:hypothetical protein